MSEAIQNWILSTTFDSIPPLSLQVNAGNVFREGRRRTRRERDKFADEERRSLASVPTGERFREGLLRSARRERDKSTSGTGSFLPLDSTHGNVLEEVVARRERGREGRARALPKDSAVLDNVLLLGFGLGVDRVEPGTVQGIDREERKKGTRSEDEAAKCVFRSVGRRFRERS